MERTVVCQAYNMGEQKEAKTLTPVNRYNNESLRPTHQEYNIRIRACNGQEARTGTGLLRQLMS